MNIKKVTLFCLSLHGASEESAGDPYNIHAFKIGGKKFAYYKTTEPEKFRFSVRVTPSRFIELTDQPGIKPARYMHRFHWVTIVNVESMPDAYLKELIAWSYARAVDSLKKTERKALGV